ncbi:MAG TPA: folylpolyglutamate synthase/dihydrofolate synthase family protein [Candidatus Angelobacter sp.]|nr:folylpolyglutamate synthase/dihydrofolate synthase family protein [Candidatus Angelobacter sp.]
MTYAETIQFLYGLNLFGANFGLEPTRKLAALAGNPQDKLRLIHVAGTNGKGSTCAILESIYRAAGLRVGLFTSPHLVSFRERIQVNRQCISEDDIVRLVGEVRLANRENEATLFEFTTVIALKFFAEQACDLVIWETGLGGRLDATNIVSPLASVITNIALDHQQWLGDTLDKIAAEKAGIIKPGIPVITAAEPPALGVIEAVARAQNAPLTKINPPATSARQSDLIASLPLAGDHQKLNAALALATVEVLQPRMCVSEAALRQGLASVSWPGRLQLIQRQDGQRILLDGAHNLAGAKVLSEALASHFPAGKRTLILGILQDKNWQPICEQLAPLAEKIITVPVASTRTASPAELAGVCRAIHPAAEIVCADSLKEAFEQCAGEAFVVLTGSLYLVGEAMELLGVSPAGTHERGLNEWQVKG